MDSPSEEISNEYTPRPPEVAPQISIEDEAVTVEETGGLNSKKGEPPRLMLLSSKVKFTQIMQAAILPNVELVIYKHEQCDLDGILSTIVTRVGAQQFESVALILHNVGAVVSLCGADEKFLTKENIIEMTSVREFFRTLTRNHIDMGWVNARIDLLMCSAALNHDGEFISAEISQICSLPCAVSKDLVGSDIPIKRIAEDSRDSLDRKARTVGSLYFKLDKLRPTSSRQSLALFEKIRVVGKGAFGSAVLYRKKDDESLVILKEVNMHDLSAQERQMALNEVKVLSMLDHPNVISYFDSFEEDGLLMIEMDYADGGTLGKFLAERNEPLDEFKILDMFQQMVAAIRHIHGHNILHRDLKTANIFLTKDGVIKVGDFGISKMMTTGARGANTVVGTPYYISPEMCEGKPYGPKSDIWAMGCILYEMACLAKTFEGSNLPAVVNKIMKGFYTPVKGAYSEDFKSIVERMLGKDPNHRPSADELWTDILPAIMSKYSHTGRDEEEDQASQDRRKRTNSVLYYQSRNTLSLNQIHHFNRIKIKEISVSKEHAILVSDECFVYTYGRGTEGQLGHGDLISRSYPELVDVLKGKSINKARAGDGFSLFASSNGIVITCGDNTTGCLGHPDTKSVTKPKLIEALLSVDVKDVDCGPQHVAVVSNSGEVYTWGTGENGRLGLGSEVNVCIPQKVTFSEPVKITNVFCGENGTMFLTDVGSVWACGSNWCNKLGLNNRMGFIAQLKHAFNKTEVEGCKIPLLVRDLCRYKIIDISMGRYHTAVLDKGGNLITFGYNSEGQLGSGDNKEQQGLVNVRILDDVKVMRASCTELSTVVSTLSGELLYWGSRYKTLQPLTRNYLDPNKRLSSAGSMRSIERSVSQTSLTVDRFSDRPGSGTSTDTSLRSPELRRSISSAKSRMTTPIRKVPTDDLETTLRPCNLILLESEHTESVVLDAFECHEENTLIVVETTAPTKEKKKRREKRALHRSTTISTGSLAGCVNLKNSASSREGGDELSNNEVESELDTLSSTMPSWIRQEIEQADSVLAVVESDDDKTSSGPPVAKIKPQIVRNTSPNTRSRGPKTRSRGETHLSSSEGDSDVDPESVLATPRQPQPTTQRPRKSGKKFNRVQPMPSQADPVPSMKTTFGRPQAFASGTEESPEHLRQEVSRLKSQTETAEERLSMIEQGYQSRVEEMRGETERRKNEHEVQLQREVQLLREQLLEQNRRMQENQKLYLGLQEQMLTLQKSSQTPTQPRRSQSQPTSKSSICLIQ